MTQRERLESIYDDYAARVYAYALRHCGRDDADDVVSETFAAAWRRIEVVPVPALPWLLVTAGNVMRNRRRADVRRSVLAEHLAQVHEPDASGADSIVAERMQLIEALQRLSELEREALLLVAWDGLDTRSAAEVARCAPRAFRARLTRARARLSSEPRRHCPYRSPRRPRHERRRDAARSRARPRADAP
ncbi:sigma-70 family RNA polymerase sigma factor [Aeromicrobium sp. UC242_57]|uniref:sigma-70 family RNA polymerase sigma factor n=1 Tax=Aeromicrobium sp. UC242_57 TaxID=3374624 RepID=UPI0037A3AEF4